MKIVKIGFITITILITAIICLGCSFHPVPAEETDSTAIAHTYLSDKVVLSDHMLAAQAYPDMEFMMEHSDLAIYGEIVKIEPGELELKSGTPADEKLSGLSGGIPTMKCIIYTVKIIDTIMGASDDTTIQCCLLGDFGELMTKPEKLGKVVMVLFDNGNPQGYYFSSGYEHTIFSIDTQNKVYSYSNVVEIATYDGKDVSTLIEDLRSIASRFGTKHGFLNP